MKSSFSRIVILVAALGLLPAAAFAVTRNVVATTEFQIQKAIDALPAEGGTVVVSAPAHKSVLIRKSIVIARDNLILRGEGGVVLKLADAAQAPVIIIGSDAAVPTATHRNIHLSDLTIDGNRTNQASELNPLNNALRNNGISLRGVEDCSVRRVAIHACRSGGLVTELTCRRLTISDIESYDNHFDGLAGYQTVESLFVNLKIHDNLAAGFSFDIAFNRNVLSNCVLTGNHDVGIFMRDSRDNAFADFQIGGNLNHGIFLAQVDADTTKPALGNTFHGCVIADSTGAGIRVNDASCTGNLLAASQLVNNAGGGVSEASAGLLTVSGVIVR